MKKIGLMTLVALTTLGGTSLLVNAETDTKSNATFTVEDGVRELTQAPSFTGEKQTIDGSGKETVDMTAENTLNLKNFMNSDKEWKLNVSMTDFTKSKDTKAATESFAGELAIAAPTTESKNAPEIKPFTANGGSTTVIESNSNLGEFSYEFSTATLTLKDTTIDKLATGDYNATLNWTMSPGGTYTHATAATPKTK